jgi:hypothetical protein
LEHFCGTRTIQNNEGDYHKYKLLIFSILIIKERILNLLLFTIYELSTKIFQEPIKTKKTQVLMICVFGII